MDSPAKQVFPAADCETEMGNGDSDDLRKTDKIEGKLIVGDDMVHPGGPGFWCTRFKC